MSHSAKCGDLTFMYSTTFPSQAQLPGARVEGWRLSSSSESSSLPDSAPAGRWAVGRTDPACALRAAATSLPGGALRVGTTTTTSPSLTASTLFWSSDTAARLCTNVKDPTGRPTASAHASFTSATV
eukprot:CAMPEP_0119104798 /NCGR_PEP_ID=MMETSP1180-20130426/2920_1 /TAXON_ID=3052 ORGANISM="Chlamydomonas cf sp, Strain CCMP681" /NCGR_SAMPLE_ID=MMETSP1180 /ASSEMBLY_ACC=CAM_ASM_000741 /LENGTH=126 /DNA_ID=CAMNT_0007089643 /DNA_START=700 /DNA_END=1080 /DNA_ORIENTATION=+